MIAPEPGERINTQTKLSVLLRNNLLASALIFALLQLWRPYFFLTDDNLDGAFPFFTEIGQRLLSGHSPFVSDHLFGGNYNLLRDPTYFAWYPLYLLTSLLAGTPFHLAIIDVDAFAMMMLTTAGFVTLAYHLRCEMKLSITDGWITFYALSFTYTMVAMTCGASWVTFLGAYSALPWLVLGVLQKSWRAGTGIVLLFALHQMLAGHLLATTSNTIFLSLFALGVSISRRSWLPLLNWGVGYTVAVILILPLLVPMLHGFFQSVRSQGVTLDDMQASRIPALDFLPSMFMGSAAWIFFPYGGFPTTNPLALGACAAAWCVIPAVFSREKWRDLEIVTVVMLIFGVVLICRPTVVSKIMLHLPLLRSMRWPVREFVQFQFFLHLFLLIRRPGLTAQIRRMLGLFGTCFFVGSLAYSNPPTFNPMEPDRHLLRTGQLDRYWDRVGLLLKPGDRVVVLISLQHYGESWSDGPFSLLGAFDYAELAGIVNASGYSPTVPEDQAYLKIPPATFFGAYDVAQKQELLKEHPDLKFITLVSWAPLKITLSSAEGPTIDLTPYLPAELTKTSASH